MYCTFSKGLSHGCGGMRMYISTLHRSSHAIQQTLLSLPTLCKIGLHARMTSLINTASSLSCIASESTCTAADSFPLASPVSLMATFAGFPFTCHCSNISVELN